MKRILLVEDEILISLNSSMLLEDEGFAVDVAFNGEQGLDLALARSPDLIVTDYMMPRMDGLTFIMEARARGVTVPILLTTSMPEKGLSETYRGGHDAYLAKPYNAEQLLALVQRLLG